MGQPRRWAALALMGLVAAASTTSCSLVRSASLAPSNSSQTPATGTGPATANFDLTGTLGLTGPVTTHEVLCGQPSVDGPQIFFQGQSATARTMIVMFVRVGHVEVRAATGSASTLRLRTFVGPGVTAFNATSGAQLNSSLTEITQAGSATGSIGALTSISGTIYCGDQQQGTSSVVISGVSPFGPLGGTLSSAKVICTVTASGTFVGISGLMATGATPLLVFVTASTGLLQVGLETRSSGSFYNGKAAGIVTLALTGAHVAGDVTEIVKAGVTPHRLHVTGEATCGLK